MEQCINQACHNFDSSLPLIIEVKAHEMNTEHLIQPYDVRLGRLFLSITENLILRYKASLAYTQGSNIYLVWKPQKEQGYGFKGKYQVLATNIASYTTLLFQQLNNLKEKPEWWVTFDVFCYNVASLNEVDSIIKKKQYEVVRKTVAIICELYYSKEEIFKKSTEERKKMITKKGDAWENYEDHFRKGILFKREKDHGTQKYVIIKC